MPLEIAVLKFFNLTLANPVFDSICVYFTNIVYWGPPLALAIFLLIWKGGRKFIILVIFSAVTVALIDPTVYYILKPLFARIRPCHEESLAWLRLIAGCGGRYGFPSSHAANMFGQAVIIGGFYPASRKFIYPLASIVALSRVYLGVHYPSDILGGAVYGAIAGFLILMLAKRFAPARIGKYIGHSGEIGKRPV